MNFSSHHPESHVTLVDDNMEANAISRSKLEDTSAIITHHSDHQGKKLWIDRLFGFFCVKSSNRNAIAGALNKLEAGGSFSPYPSPWILPVYVVSDQQGLDKHPVTKIAKCTIDTGNMQGNIVSREFVEKVLGFPPSSFGKLTQEEQSGGTGITGDLHIPQGAINLTWYHNNSTRVFRNMRFLISPSNHCDLIIGAWSIQKDKILDVPCLMVNKPSQSDVIHFNPSRYKDPDRRKLGFINHDVWNEYHTRQGDQEEDPGTPGSITYIKHEKNINQSIIEVDIVGWLIIVWEFAFPEKKGQGTLKHADIVEIWDEVNKDWYGMRPEIQDKLEKRFFYEKLTNELGLKNDRVKSGGKSSAIQK